MHFAQTLEASTIPEWKSQYVDFKQGKKLISKLEKQLQNALPSNWDLPPPAMSIVSPTHSSPTHSLDNHANENAGQPPIQEIPPAYRRSGAPIIDESSPLLETPATRLYNTPDPATRQAASAQHNSQSSSGLPNSIPLSELQTEEDARRNVRKQFFAWLSIQNVKAADFYAGMLDEAETKLAVLEMQFAHFDVHRKEHQEEKTRANPQHQATSNLFRSLDLPSLPEVFKSSLFSDSLRRPRRRARIPRVVAHTSDFNNKDDHVGYYQAKTMLRSSLINFFQFLLQLREFRQLNQTAVRKIIKKFDKQLQFRTLDKYMKETKNMSLRSSDRLDTIISRVEELFANEFTKGNHKLAVDLLRAHFLKQERPRSLSVMFSGFTLGAAVPLIVLGLYAALHYQYELPAETNYMLQMYGAFSLIGLMFVGFGACLMFWSHYRINYPFILDFDRSTMLDPRQFLVLPGLYFLGLGLFGWLSFNTVQSFHRYYPCLYLGIAVAVLAFPSVKHFQGYSRLWLLHSLWRLLLSGLYPVEFRDLMMGDLMCSLTYSLSTLELFFCVYATPHWWSGEGARHALRCTSSQSRALGFLNCLPGIWRFLQCWRRYADTLDWFPHLLNAGKYTFNILYNMSLSLARISPHHTGLKAMFIVFALINGIYSGTWDVLMDFSLVPSAQPREILVYPKSFYWAAMALDMIMRQNWVLYVIFWNHKTQGATISYVVALIEASRRVIWLAFRVENEHAANMARCRAFKELNLPYDDATADVASHPHFTNHECTPPGVRRRPATFDAAADSRIRAAPSVEPGATRSPAEIIPNHAAKRASTLFDPDAASPIAIPAYPPHRYSPKSQPLSPFALSPRLRYAHTNDFQRKKAPIHDIDEEEEEEEEETEG